MSLESNSRAGGEPWCVGRTGKNGVEECVTYDLGCYQEHEEDILRMIAVIEALIAEFSNSDR